MVDYVIIILLGFIVGYIVIPFKNLFTDTPRPVLPPVNNYEGIPPEGMSWDEAWKYVKPSIVPMTTPDHITECPMCGDILSKYQSAPMYEDEVYEEGDSKVLVQYNVVGQYCKKGHWTNLSCA